MNSASRSTDPGHTFQNERFYDMSYSNHHSSPNLNDADLYYTVNDKAYPVEQDGIDLGDKYQSSLSLYHQYSHWLTILSEVAGVVGIEYRPLDCRQTRWQRHIRRCCCLNRR